MTITYTLEEILDFTYYLGGVFCATCKATSFSSRLLSHPRLDSRLQYLL